MKNFTPIPTANIEWGFWGTSKSNGYDAALTWDTTTRFLAEHFDLNAEQARDVLDSRFGRHLADDLSFIEAKEKGIANGPSSAKAITDHLLSRIADKGWRDCFEKAIREETGKTYKPKLRSKDDIFTEIAQHHLGFDTLVCRMSDSLDFKDVSVLSVKDALEAAYEAGRASAKRKGT